MAIIDGVFLAIVLVAAIRGAVRGFVAEVFTVAAIGLGLATAALVHPRVAAQLDLWWGVSPWNRVVGFLALFLAVYVVVKIFETLLHRFFERLRLERLDHSLGLFVGLAEGLALVFIIFLMLTVQPIVDTRPWFRGSLFQELFVPLLLDAFDLGPPARPVPVLAVLAGGMQLRRGAT